MANTLAEPCLSRYHDDDNGPMTTLPALLRATGTNYERNATNHRGG